MISNPRHGWCSFKLDWLEGAPSYLTDVPLELLNCFLSYYENGAGACRFDEEEDGTFILVLSGPTAYIIEEKERLPLHEFATHPDDLAEELLRDIDTHLDEWFSWIPGFEFLNEEEKHARATEINDAYCRLSNILRNITNRTKKAELEDNR